MIGPSVSEEVEITLKVIGKEGLNKNLTFVYPCIASIFVNDDQQDATILAYLFIPNQLYMFRAMCSPISRST